MNHIADLLGALCKSPGVAGAELSAVKAAKEHLAPYAKTMQIQPQGSLFATIVSPPRGGEHILLEAHIDEVGLIVTSITPDGFLQVEACGGVDRKLLLGQEVVVHGKQEVYGVLSSTPPHLQSAKTRASVPAMEEIFLDVGLKRERAEKLISPGDRVTFAVSPARLSGSRFTAKALDDRAGVAAVLLSLQTLAKRKLHCGLSVLLSTQEELGGAGAKTGGFSAYPTSAICVDVSFAQSIGCPEHKCKEMGKGPMIGIAPVLDDSLGRSLQELADQNGIPYQLEVMGGQTATDADYIALCAGGVKTALLSIPQRYMHTPVEMVDLADIQATADLITAYVTKKGGEDK